MTFGDASTFELIVRFIKHEDRNAGEQLGRILQEDCRSVASRFTDISYEDREDVAQETSMNLWLKLIIFYDDPDMNRNGYLTRAVQNACRDLLNKRRETVSIDELPELDTEDSPERIIEKRETAFDALEMIFRQNTSPEKMLAFVLSQLEKNAKTGGGSGSPTAICEKYCGNFTLMDMYRMMLYYFKLIGIPVPPRVTEPLLKRIGSDADKVFYLDPDIVRKTNSRFTKMIKENIKR